MLLLAAGAAAAALSPGLVAPQDVAALDSVPISPAVRWRAHLVAAPVAPSRLAAFDSFDARLRADDADRVPAAVGFVVSDATPPPDPVPDGAARSARLALAPDLALRLNYLSVPAAPDDGKGAPVVATPDGGTPTAVALLADTTPGDAAPPKATAGLPVSPSLGLFANGADRLLAAARVDGPILQLAPRAMIAPADLPKAEKCMATAIYFEARGEPVRGQYAVAQVVMNRVRSPDFPDNVCDVVYQNADWYNHCQFSFACDGRTERVFDRAAWNRAQKIAADVIVKGVYLPDVGTATNYHADYVRPRWARAMIRKETLGRHIFYNDPTLAGEMAPLAFAGQ